MVYNLYSIYDSVAEEFGPLFHSKSDAVAKRAVTTVLHEGVKASDYDLYMIGTYDVDLGIIEPSKSFVCNCIDILGSEDVEV